MKKTRVDQVQVRALPAEKASWQVAADREGLPLAGWIRQLANREVRRAGGDQAALAGTGDQS